jgi:hypothetical protein
MQLAQAALPQPHLGTKVFVDVEQHVGARALVGLERAEHVFSRKRVEIVVVQAVRH